MINRPPSPPVSARAIAPTPANGASKPGTVLASSVPRRPPPPRARGAAPAPDAALAAVRARPAPPPRPGNPPAAGIRLPSYFDPPVRRQAPNIGENLSQKITETRPPIRQSHAVSRPRSTLDRPNTGCASRPQFRSRRQKGRCTRRENRSRGRTRYRMIFPGKEGSPVFRAPFTLCGPRAHSRPGAVPASDAPRCDR